MGNIPYVQRDAYHAQNIILFNLKTLNDQLNALMIKTKNSFPEIDLPYCLPYDGNTLNEKLPIGLKM